MKDNMPQEKRDELIKIMDECDHSGPRTPFPDSLASMCENCGKMFIGDEPWDYKSGNVQEWLYDLYGAPSDGN